MLYIPREVKKYDDLYGEDAISQYNRTFLLEFYIKSIDGFTGDGQFMSKFGLEIRDQVVFSVSQRVFGEEVASITNQLRPNEGDLVYFPLHQKTFQIKFVNRVEMYEFGHLQVWDLTCELFEYSNEEFNTGIPEIDVLQTKFSTNILDYSIMDHNSDYLTDQNDDYIVIESYDLETINPSAQNDTIESGSDNFPLGSDDFIDFTEIDPFSEGVNL